MCSQATTATEISFPCATGARAFSMKVSLACEYGRLRQECGTSHVSCYWNLQMLCTLTDITDDKAFNCWSNNGGEGVLIDVAEEAKI